MNQDPRWKIDKGSLSEDDASRLRNWVLEDPSALGAVASMPGAGVEGNFNPAGSQAPPPRPRKTRGWLGIAGLSALLLGGGGWWLARGGGAAAAEPASPFVTVYDSTDAGGFKVGQVVRPGRYEMGAAEEVSMVFRSGARVEVKGPGAFEILGERKMFMQQGLLRAKVDGKLGPFQIDTPDGRVVDLGTAFTVAKPYQGSTEVHVDKGSVRLEGNESDLLLHENQAASVSSGKMISEDYLKHRFETPLNLPQILNDPARSMVKPWKAAWNLADAKPGEPPPLDSGSFKLMGGLVVEGLDYQSGGYALETTPNAIMTGSTSQDFECSVVLGQEAQGKTDPVYLSFLMKIPHPEPGLEKAYAGISFLTQARYESFFVGDGWYKEGLCTHGNDSSDPIEAANTETPLGIPLDNKTILVVLRLDPLRKVTDVWINPPLGLKAAPDSADFRWQDVPQFDLVGLRSGRWFHGGGYVCIFDELRAGSDWGSVLPVSESK